MLHRTCVIAQRHPSAHTLWHHLIPPPTSQPAEVLSQNFWRITLFLPKWTYKYVHSASWRTGRSLFSVRLRKEMISLLLLALTVSLFGIQSHYEPHRSAQSELAAHFPPTWGQFYWFHCKWQQKKSEATFLETGKSLAAQMTDLTTTLRLQLKVQSLR